jgi:tRNA threonylcarbamoyl adenosine modification protein (Sua5/YciO/YrdC/YwlC family)
MGLLLKIHPVTPAEKEILKVVEILRNGGVIIYPTDSVYGIGCDMNNKKAVERVAQFKGIRVEKANFSIICHDLSDLSDYTLPINTSLFKIMKKNLPGPFTFILPASKNVPRILDSSRKSIGIRIPDNNIVREIVKYLGNPIITTSVHDDDEVIEYTTDPELIWEKYKDMADLVIDGGYGNNEASTVIDCTKGEYEVVREGIGELLE